MAASTHHWKRVRELFDGAVELSPGDRSAYLDRECADNAEIRHEVERLLRAESAGKDRIEEVLQNAASDLTERWVSSDLEPGETLGKYLIVKKLGEGGMGSVFIAEDTELRRRVALKVITGTKALLPNNLERLKREARALAALNHPNIVTIYSVEHQGDLDFLAMELLEGASLDELIPAQGLELSRFFELAIPLSSALSAAHEQGVTHRDLKPANVVVGSRGNLKILDFGLAKFDQGCLIPDGHTASRASLTRTGIVMGTVPYMSPEQAEGKPLDHRTDIFSFGAMLYEMATGSRPFAGDTSAALISAILKESPPRVTALVPRLPPRLADIIARCLEKDRERRYQDSANLAKDLEDLRDAIQLHPRLSSGISRASSLLSRSRRVRLSILSMLVAVVVIGLTIGWLSTREKPANTSPVSIEVASLAVLPMTNLSGDAEQEYLADGMTEILITELSKVSSLKVISRTSAMRFKDTDLPMAQIAAQLGVDAVIEGSVLRSGDRVRVTAQLIHGISDEHLWADSFERDVRDLFGLQREVARAIALQVNATLTPEEQARLARGETVEPRASEAYLRGRNHWNGFDFVAAAEAFQEAIELDPDFARAWAGLAHARQMQGVIGFPHPPKIAYALAETAVRRALELDDALAEAHAVAGSIAFHSEWDWSRAERSFNRAIEIKPSEPFAHTGLSYLKAAIGHLDEALDSARLAKSIDPLAPMTNVTIAEIHYYSRSYDQALFQLGEEWNESFRPNNWLQSRILEAQGDRQAAAWADLRAWQAGSPPDLVARLEDALTSAGVDGYWTELLRYMTAWPPEAIHAKVVAEIHTRLGQTDAALEWLERAIERRDPVAHIGVDPIWDPLRSEGRFNELLMRMEIPQAARPAA